MKNSNLFSKAEMTGLGGKNDWCDSGFVILVNVNDSK